MEMIPGSRKAFVLAKYCMNIQKTDLVRRPSIGRVEEEEENNRNCQRKFSEVEREISLAITVKPMSPTFPFFCPTSLS